jgi:hypothetical protein
MSLDFYGLDIGVFLAWACQTYTYSGLEMSSAGGGVVQW